MITEHNAAIRAVVLKYYKGELTYKEYQQAVLEVWKGIGK
jgi:hypothetical protein